MINQLKVIWFGLGGAFAGFHPVETKLWIYISGVLFNIGLLVMNSFISFSFDRDTLWQASVGLSPDIAFNLALLSTTLLAFVALHFISYLGFLASAKVHKQKSLLAGVTRWSVFFTILAVMAVLAMEIYRNYHGSEDIAKSNTQSHMADPTASLDDKYNAQEDSLKSDFKAQISLLQRQIDLVNHWTGKSHSCTRTGCPTKKKGQGTIGAHWKGTLTSFGTETIQQLKTRLNELETAKTYEISVLRTRKNEVMASSVAMFRSDVNRYNRELQLKNRTFKGFVFIAFPAAFVIAFLLSNITYIGIEYLYETGKLERPSVTLSPNGVPISGNGSTPVPMDIDPMNNGKALTEEKVKERFSDRQCAYCGTDIQYKRRDAKTCSDPCRIAYNEWKKGYSVAGVIHNRKRG